MRYLLLLCALVLGLPVAGAELRFNFGDLASGGSLTNFHAELFGDGSPGVWQVLPGKAPSAFTPLSVQSTNTSSGGGSVLAQTSQDATLARYPLFIYDGEKFRNFRLATQFKLVSGMAAQMAGMVLRFQNTTNFYVVRVNGLNKKVGFYKVEDGLPGKAVETHCDIDPGTWHWLAAQCDGDHITIWIDGHPAMTVVDDRYAEGKIGFWTKSDSVTYFANAVVDYTPVIPAGQLLVNKVMELEPRILGLQIYTLDTNNVTSVLASNDPSERGQPGTSYELGAIRDGTTFFGRQGDADYVTMPLHDRNGDYIAAVRFKLKSFFGETQQNAVLRATLVLNVMQGMCTSAEDLLK